MARHRHVFKWGLGCETMVEKNKKEILEELKEAFEKAKKEIGFSASYEQIEKVFNISDYVLRCGFVSEVFSRQLCTRILEKYMNLNHYFHSLVIANPQDLINMNECKMINEETKKKMLKIMSKSMILASLNNSVELNYSKEEEAKLIDESLRVWNEDYLPVAQEVIKQIADGWSKK